MSKSKQYRLIIDPELLKKQLNTLVMMQGLDTIVMRQGRYTNTYIEDTLIGIENLLTDILSQTNEEI